MFKTDSAFRPEDSARRYPACFNPGRVDPSGLPQTILDGENDAIGILTARDCTVIINRIAIKNAARKFWLASLRDGAGLFAVDSTITLRGCLFENNAGANGAGIGILRGSLVVDSCDFSENIAFINGGGVYLSDTTATIESSTFYFNTAYASQENEGGGGILVANNSEVSIIQTSFEYNQAANGGGISNLSGLVTIDGCEFSNNTANQSRVGEGAGGGLFNKSVAEVGNSAFTDNDATVSGGAITNTGILNVSSTSISNNSALTGDGIYCSGAHECSVAGTIDDEIIEE